MEIENYICPNCQVKLKRSIWEEKYTNFIDDIKVYSYEGICKNCKSRFSFFYDPSYDKAVFWKKNDENIFLNLIEKKLFLSSIRVVYLLNNKKFSIIEKLPLLTSNIIVTSYEFSDFINKLDLRKNNKIVFIDKDILDTRFEKNYPCILAEKNIYEMVKNYKNYHLYSDHKTYYNFFEYLGE
jgi:hypothetical protein